MARVYLMAEAKADLRALDGSVRKVVINTLVKLADEPEHRGQPLGSQTGSDLTTFRKLVVGKRAYRIVFRVERDGTICVVWVIGARVDRQAYETAVERMLAQSGPQAEAEMKQVLDDLFPREP